MTNQATHMIIQIDQLITLRSSLDSRFSMNAEATEAVTPCFPTNWHLSFFPKLWAYDASSFFSFIVKLTGREVSFTVSSDSYSSSCFAISPPLSSSSTISPPLSSSSARSFSNCSWGMECGSMDWGEGVWGNATEEEESELQRKRGRAEEWKEKRVVRRGEKVAAAAAVAVVVGETQKKEKTEGDASGDGGGRRRRWWSRWVDDKDDAAIFVRNCELTSVFLQQNIR